MNFKAWQASAFASTWLAYVAYYFCRKPFSAAKAPLGEELGWSPSDLGDLWAIYLVCYTLGQFASAGIGGKYGPRALLLGGMLISALAHGGFGLTDNYWTFASFMAVNGLAQATGWAGGVGTMAQWFRKEERGTVMGFWATNFQVGSAAATGFAAWVLGTWGVDGAFFAGSAVMLTAWTVVLLLQRNKPEDVGLPPLPEEEAVAVAPDQPAGKWPVVLIVNVGLIGAFYFCVKFLRYALDSWVPFLLARDYGLDYDDAGYVSLLFPVGGTLGVVAAGVLSDRWFGGRRAGISFWFVSGLVVTCLALYTFGGASLTVFAATQLFLGFFLYGPDALLTGAGAMDVGSRRRAVVAAGLINGTGTLGAVLQELVLGRLLDDSDSNAVFGVLLGSAVGALFFLGILVFRGRGGRSAV
jgi:sugar phosphate permease